MECGSVGRASSVVREIRHLVGLGFANDERPTTNDNSSER